MRGKLARMPACEQVTFIFDLLKSMVHAIVERVDGVRISTVITSTTVAFTVSVHHDDMGLVIGEGGATANAIRRIVWTACKKTDRRVDIEFVA